MVPRKTHLRNVEALLRDSPVGAMIGARQVGKTTLARQLVQQYRAPAHVFDLESSADLAQRQRMADDHHYRQADDLKRTVEIAEGIVHHCRLRGLAFRFKPVFSDSASHPVR